MFDDPAGCRGEIRARSKRGFSYRECAASSACGPRGELRYVSLIRLVKYVKGEPK